jgi:hypothetical protein
MGLDCSRGASECSGKYSLFEMKPRLYLYPGILFYMLSLLKHEMTESIMSILD